MFEVQTRFLNVERDTPLVPGFRYGPNSPPNRWAVGSFPFFDIGFTSSVNHGNSVGRACEDTQPATRACIANDFRFAIAFNGHQWTSDINMVEFNGIIIANDGALVATDALSFLDKGDRAFSTFGAGTLFTPLPIEGRSDTKGLLFAALPQFIGAGHAKASAVGSPSNLATHKFTKTSPKQ